MSVELKLSYKGGESRRMECEFASGTLGGLPIRLHDCVTGTDYYYPDFKKMVSQWDFPTGKVENDTDNQ